MDVSDVMAGSFHGLEIEIQRHPGVRVLRVVHPGRQAIAEHRHDWAYIGIHTLGRYCETFDGGEAELAGPSAVLHPPGRPHSDWVADEGLETLTVEFDRVWLRAHGFDGCLDRSLLWQGGAAGVAARRLARVACRPCSEATLGLATRTFLQVAYRSEPAIAPPWLQHVTHKLQGAGFLSTRELAHSLNLNADYLARTYRYVTGEGIHETARRRRVEHATMLLRRSDMPLVDVALVSGFCDQSHMNRGFRAILGRTPAVVRAEGRPPRPQGVEAPELEKVGALSFPVC